MKQAEFKFDGSDYTPQQDNARLTRQSDKILNLMRDGVYRTLEQISQLTKEPQASVSAQLRHFRKPKFGSHTINKRHKGNGIYEYQLLINKNYNLNQKP